MAGKDHRERPWRLVATSYSWGQVRDTAEGSVAVGVLEQLRAERAVEALLDWQQRRRDWPAGWREHSGIGESTVYLTQSELAAIDEAINAVLQAVYRRAADRRRGLPAAGLGTGDVHAVHGAWRTAGKTGEGLTCGRRGGCWPAGET